MVTRPCQRGVERGCWQCIARGVFKLEEGKHPLGCRWNPAWDRMASVMTLSCNKAIVDSRLRPQSQWSRRKSAFLCLAYARHCDFSVGFPSRHCLFTNNCHAHWHAIGEIRSGHEILARDWSARIIYAWQTYRQTDCNTSLPLAGEVIKEASRGFSTATERYLFVY